MQMMKMKLMFVEFADFILGHMLDILRESMQGYMIVRGPLREVGFWKLSSSKSTVAVLSKECR
jgi:hypothetical protein